MLVSRVPASWPGQNKKTTRSGAYVQANRSLDTRAALPRELEHDLEIAQHCLS